jgi:hypothetical protein
MELLQEAHPLMNKKRGIQGVAQETQSSWANLWGAFGCLLIEAHEGFKEAHSSILSQRKEPIEIASLRVACYIIDESFYTHIVVAPNTSCSTSKSNPFGWWIHLWFISHCGKWDTQEGGAHSCTRQGLWRWGPLAKMLGVKGSPLTRVLAILPRKVKWPLLLTKHNLWGAMVGFATSASKLGT